MNNSFDLICIWFTDSSDSENSDYDIIQEEDVKRLRGKPLPGKIIFRSMERLRWPPAIGFHLSPCVLWPPFNIEQFFFWNYTFLGWSWQKAFMNPGVGFTLGNERNLVEPIVYFVKKKISVFMHSTRVPSLQYKQKTWLAHLHNTVQRISAFTPIR